jgi:hypothetical protein
MIWYPYATSTQFPELGTGNRTIMAGPVYHFDPLLESPIKLPAYYDDTLFIYEWSRNWIKEVKLDANGNILKINPFAVNAPLVRPMDMELGPDGALYVLEWGTSFGGNNANAQLVRIEFLGSPLIVSADFDGSGVVDGGDFLTWQRGFGLPGGATRGDGDANVDGRVDNVDLGLWAGALGGATALSAAKIGVAATVRDQALAEFAGGGDLSSGGAAAALISAPPERTRNGAPANLDWKSFATKWRSEGVSRRASMLDDGAVINKARAAGGLLGRRESKREALGDSLEPDDQNSLDAIASALVASWNGLAD